MQLRKILAPSATALILALTLSSSAVAGEPTGAASSGVTLAEIKSDFSMLFTEENAGGIVKPVFSGILDYKTSVGYVAVLPNCTEDPANPCVKSFEASIDSGKTWVKAASSKSYAAKTFDQSKYPAGSYIVQTKNWIGDEKTLLPSGADTSVYSFPKGQHFGGAEYMLQPIIEGVSSTQTANARAHKLSLSITPIRTYAAPNPNICSLWLTTCFDVFNFKSDVTFRVVLDLKYLAPTFSGWFQSRIRNSEIQQLGTTEFSFTGSSMYVSSVLAEFNKPYSEDLILAYPNVKTGLILNQYEYKLQQVFSNTNAGIKNWIRFEKDISNKAKWESSMWSAVSYSTSSRGDIYSQMNGCLQYSKGILGQVSTNATVYEISAPLWDKDSDSLSFTVAAPSFDSNGDKKKGVYDLALREDIAKCLWGKDLAKSSAKIEILNSDGTSQVATTTFKLSNGFVYFRAAGFHYSVPKIKVSVVDSPASSTSKAAATSKKATSITCIKGTAAKKVTAVKPKCPAGYKKK
jgi:hypothetical protein